MKTTTMKKNILMAITILCVSGLAGCNVYRTVIENKQVTAIPDVRYERIIKLYNPDGRPDKTLTGVVFIKEGAKVCTDYPREQTIKSLDDLEMMEKAAYPYFSRYAIEDGGGVFGYIALSIDYRAMIYKNAENEDCVYKVVITGPRHPDLRDGLPRTDRILR